MPHTTPKKKTPRSTQSAKEQYVHPVVKTAYFKFGLPAILAFTLPLFVYFTRMMFTESRRMTLAASEWQEQYYVPTLEAPTPPRVIPYDQMTKFNSKSLYAALSVSGPEARGIYLDDYLSWACYFPLVYTPLFYAALGLTFLPRVKSESESALWMVAVPVATMLLDVYEKYQIAAVVKSFPEELSGYSVNLAGNVGLVRQILMFFMYGSIAGTWVSMGIKFVRDTRAIVAAKAEKKDN
ncbi:hypothetical protein BJ742DRAFT_768835 [Cladochytrium replicatum]|nr:hypothetical protein BJ742DRAFT_768835 [Cladochytrium replicatum]